MKSDEENYEGHFLKSLKGVDDMQDYIEYQSSRALALHFGGKKNQGKLVIDFGGRIGERTMKIKNRVVVEVDRTATEWMKKNKIKHVTSIEKIKDSSADAIYASHVLEHIADTDKYLKLFYKKLKKGGKLIIALPAENQMFEPKKPIYDQMGHVHCWNLSNMMILLQNYGFLPLEWKFFCFPERIFRSLIEKLFKKNMKTRKKYKKKLIGFFAFYSKSRLLRHFFYSLKCIALMLSGKSIGEYVIVAKKQGN